MTVGERIKKTRMEKGLSQGDLAKIMGYSNRQSVSRAELYGDNITTSKVKRFADALGVSFDYLMGWEEDVIQKDENNESLRKALMFVAYMKQLNEEGIEEAMKRIEELTELPKYRKENDED